MAHVSDSCCNIMAAGSCRGQRRAPSLACVGRSPLPSPSVCLCVCVLVCLHRRCLVLCAASSTRSSVFARVCSRVCVWIKIIKGNTRNVKCLDAGVKLQVCGLSQPALRAKWAILTRSTRDTIDKQNNRKSAWMRFKGLTMNPKP